MCWLPGHVGIKRNEIADSAAKSALQLPASSYKIPHSDLKCYISTVIPERFQSEWDVVATNKRRSVKPLLGKKSVTATCNVKKMSY